MAKTAKKVAARRAIQKKAPARAALQKLEQAVRHGEGRVVLSAKEPTPFQFDRKPLRKLRDHRPGTKRAKIIAMMQRPQGAQLKDILRVTGWDRKTAYEGIRLVNTYTGFGLRTDDQGRLHVYTR